ncbi:MAG TPA: MerR family transcriptional regulator [Bacillota bacterium]|nr:MerR family transcriptional regulator [Bacillota bacterium]
MDVRNCKRCGKIFSYRGIGVCNDCFEQEEKDFVDVKAYLEKHEGASTLEVSSETEVEIRTITRFLREGRLEAEGVQIIDSDLTCDKCGKPISMGRYCDDCIKKLQDELKEAAAKLQKDIPREKSSVNWGTIHIREREGK